MATRAFSLDQEEITVYFVVETDRTGLPGHMYKDLKYAKTKRTRLTTHRVQGRYERYREDQVKIYKMKFEPFSDLEEVEL